MSKSSHLSTGIEVRGIVHSFPSGKVLNGLGLSLKPGHFYSLVGPNGAGKSTLLRVLAGALPPHQGEGLVVGYDLGAHEKERAEHVVWVHEGVEFTLPDPLEKIVQLHAAICPDWNQSLVSRLRSEIALDLSKPYSSLSRGQKVQFQLLLALGRQPQVFLLDEVTAVLDVSIREVLLEALKTEAQKRGALVLAATNILSELKGYADRLLILRDGVIAHDEEFEKLAQTFGTIERAAASLAGRKAG